MPVLIHVRDALDQKYLVECLTTLGLRVSINDSEGLGVVIEGRSSYHRLRERLDMLDELGLA